MRVVLLCFYAILYFVYCLILGYAPRIAHAHSTCLVFFACDLFYTSQVPDGDSVMDFTFYNRTKWGWGNTYQLAPFNLTRAYNVRRSDGAQEVRAITYSLDWGNATAPRGFFLDGSTGEALIRIPRVRCPTIICKQLCSARFYLALLCFILLYSVILTSLDVCVQPHHQDKPVQNRAVYK